ncbi:hypothetical protein [Sutcliffiella halmapala]|uniref:hypothetical protein n=1 Tax=Sutcliffiella halmapala TaxID=79882 RepID=UPI000994EABD|nr:hypothetical protein [Sutcliffiella halmapala]
MDKKIIQTFAYTEESQFFTESKYSHIGRDFNFTALAELAAEKFAGRIKYETSRGSCYIRKFIIEENDSCFFFRFYSEGFRKENYCVTTAYHDKDNYFSVYTIYKGDFEKLGLDVTEGAAKRR